ASRRSLTATIAALVVLALAALVAGCGSSSDSGGGSAQASTGSDGLTKITVQDTQGTSASYIQYGIDRGIFRRHGLDVELQAVAGGATAIPALISGSVQIAGSNTVSIIAAAARGLPITYVAPGVFATTEPDKYSSTVFGSKSGGLRSIRDLAGKTV